MVKPNIHNVITKGSNPFKLKIIFKNTNISDATIWHFYISISTFLSSCLFFLLYLSLTYYILPALAVILKVRKRKLNDQIQKTNAITTNSIMQIINTSIQTILNTNIEQVVTKINNKNSIKNKLLNCTNTLELLNLCNKNIKNNVIKNTFVLKSSNF